MPRTETETESNAAADGRRRAAAIERMRQMVAEGRVNLDLIDENTSDAKPTGVEPTD